MVGIAQIDIVIPGWSEGPGHRCAIAHRGISRFRVRANARPGMTKQPQPGTFNSSGTAASYFELCSTSDVLTLRTWGAAVRWVTKS